MTLSNEALKRIQSFTSTQTELLKAFLDGYILGQGETTQISQAGQTPQPTITPPSIEHGHIVISTPPPSVQLPPHSRTRPRITDRVQTHRGLRGKLLRLLYTGPITIRDAIRECGEEAKRSITCTLSNFLRYGEAALDPQRPGVYRLTDKGREQAQWFVDNPNFMIRNAQAEASIAEHKGKAIKPNS